MQDSAECARLEKGFLSRPDHADVIECDDPFAAEARNFFAGQETEQ